MGLERESHLLIDGVLEILQCPGGDSAAAGIEETVLAGDGFFGAAPCAAQVLVEEGAFVAFGEIAGEGGIAGWW